MEENFMVGQIFEELVEEKGETCTMDGRRQSKPFGPNWKLWCVINSKHNNVIHCQVETIKVVMVWCTWCKLITSQTQLN